MEEHGRIMALDVGARRVGVALCDPTQTLCAPYTTLHATPELALFARLVAIVRAEEVIGVVVGMPLTLSGEVGPQAKLIEAFVVRLRPVIAPPIVTFDERLTSVEAERMMRELGLKPEQRKARIDEVAASIILQDFLDSRRYARPDAREPEHD